MQLYQLSNHEFNQQLELYSQCIDVYLYSFLYMYLRCYRVYLLVRCYYVDKSLIDYSVALWITHALND